MNSRVSAWYGPACPQDPDHGAMLDWPGAYTAWYCPHRKHVGRQFYTTDLGPAERPPVVSPLRSSREGSRASLPLDAAEPSRDEPNARPAGTRTPLE